MAMKGKVRSSILAGLAALLLSACSWKDTQLTDIAKPYLGTYECTQAHLGSLDLLDRFTDIRLELKDEENFILLYKEKGKEGKKLEGKYRYDEERGVLIATDAKEGLRREFPFAQGKLTVTFPVGRRNFVMQFERK